MDKIDSLEQDLFSWEGWDEMDIMAINFHDIILKKDIGNLKKGSKFEWATIDFKSSQLEIGINENKSEKFKLKLEIKNE